MKGRGNRSPGLKHQVFSLLQMWKLNASSLGFYVGSEDRKQSLIQNIWWVQMVLNEAAGQKHVFKTNNMSFTLDLGRLHRFSSLSSVAHTIITYRGIQRCESVKWRRRVSCLFSGKTKERKPSDKQRGSSLPVKALFTSYRVNVTFRRQSVVNLTVTLSPLPPSHINGTQQNFQYLNGTFL